jgi:hypothetical protein
VHSVYGPATAIAMASKDVCLLCGNGFTASRNVFDVVSVSYVFIVIARKLIYLSAMSMQLLVSPHSHVIVAFLERNSPLRIITRRHYPLWWTVLRLLSGIITPLVCSWKQFT